MLKRLVLPVLVLLAGGCCLLAVHLFIFFVQGADRADQSMLPPKFSKLVPLHTRLGKPQPGDWLAAHPELGQTYEEYLHSNPVRLDETRRVLYVQPLGEFARTQRKIIHLTAEFMGIYFSLPVRVQEDLPLSLVPKTARRKHPSWGMDQILSTYVLYDVLRPRLPKDAAALIALTTSDLWPGEGWNFVFGQALLNGRVGVWSLYRYGDPEQSDQSFQLCLRRTIKTATHETGHMFSMQHCTLYQCNMCGSNHLVEADRRPIWLCPHCLAKLCWATGADPQQRCEKLIEFCRTHGLKSEQEFYQQSLAALRAN